MENVSGEQHLALQQHFPYKTSKFSENSNFRINLLFHSRELKLGHFGLCIMFSERWSFLLLFRISARLLVLLLLYLSFLLSAVSKQNIKRTPNNIPTFTFF